MISGWSEVSAETNTEMTKNAGMEEFYEKMGGTSATPQSRGVGGSRG
jgi:hypothetical protein